MFWSECKQCGSRGSGLVDQSLLLACHVLRRKSGAVDLWFVGEGEGVSWSDWVVVE
jgi:hypothetical protein